MIVLENNKRTVENMAAMREALLKALTALKVCEWEEGTDMDGVKSIISEIESAIAIPLRNCDVGSVDEQYERFNYFCDKHDADCTGCPCDEDTKHISRCYCFSKWAQMPYESEVK